MSDRTCLQCAGPVSAASHDRRRKYCSGACRSAAARERGDYPRKPARRGQCPDCGVQPEKWSRGVCNPCYQIHYRRGTTDTLIPAKTRAPFVSVTVTQKRCCTCKEIKPSDAFCASKRERDGLAKRCRSCYSDARVERRELYRNFELQRKYGISAEQYDKMLAAQGHVCAICSIPRSVKFALAVDHCHETGKVRGLLCTNCNNGLGRFADDPDRLMLAALYVRGNECN